MSPALACAALAASAPMAAIGWLAGAALDHARAGPSQRHGLWEAAFWAAPLTTAAILAAARLPAGFALHGVRWLPGEVRGLAPVDAPAAWHGPSLAILLVAVALAGAVVRLTGLAIRLRRLNRVRARASLVAGDVGGLPVWLSEDVGSPILVGLRRPAILLPKSYSGPDAAEAVRLVCRHEAAHARRGDNLRLLLEETAVAVLWFNPLLGAIRRRLSAAREEVCDAAALAGLDARERRLYARSLLDCLETRACNLPAAGLIGLNRRSTTMRIDAILTPRPHRRRTALAGGLVAALVACAAAAVALAQPPPTTHDGKPAAKLGPLSITADQVVVDKARHTWRWVGNATVSGITKQTMDGLFIDGRAATEGDLANLPAVRFASIKATFNPKARELERLDALTKPD